MLTGFAASLRQAARPYFAEIKNSPFVQQLVAGSLPRRDYLRFLASDLDYLSSFSQSLSNLRAKLDVRHHHHLNLFEKNTLEEQERIRKILEAAHFYVKEKRSVWDEYALYLCETTKQQSAAAGLAALFPCFLFFCELGFDFRNKEIKAAHPYLEWVGMYTNEGFSDGVLRVAGLLNAHQTSVLQKKMREHFMCSAQYESRLFSEMMLSSAHSSISGYTYATRQNRSAFYATGLSASEACASSGRGARRSGIDPQQSGDRPGIQPTHFIL